MFLVDFPAPHHENHASVMRWVLKHPTDKENPYLSHTDTDMAQIVRVPDYRKALMFRSRGYAKEHRDSDMALSDYRLRSVLIPSELVENVPAPTYGTLVPAEQPAFAELRTLIWTAWEWRAYQPTPVLVATRAHDSIVSNPAWHSHPLGWRIDNLPPNCDIRLLTLQQTLSVANGLMSLPPV
jgi:hypothetical protein